VTLFYLFSNSRNFEDTTTVEMSGIGGPTTQFQNPKDLNF